MAGNKQYAANFLVADVKSDDDGLDAICDDCSFITERDDDVLTTSLCNSNHVGMSYKVADNILVLGDSEIMSVLLKNH